MTQSSCKRDSKSKSHSGMKLAPVRVFSSKHPLSRDLSYQTFMVNYNQESLVNPGSTRLSILIDDCQKPGKSGSTRVYQAHQAFNQTFGARVTLKSFSFRF